MHIPKNQMHLNLEDDISQKINYTTNTWQKSNSIMRLWRSKCITTAALILLSSAVIEAPSRNECASRPILVTFQHHIYLLIISCTLILLK